MYLGQGEKRLAVFSDVHLRDYLIGNFAGAPEASMEISCFLTCEAEAAPEYRGIPVARLNDIDLNDHTGIVIAVEDVSRAAALLRLLREEKRSCPKVLVIHPITVARQDNFIAENDIDPACATLFADPNMSDKLVSELLEEMRLEHENFYLRKELSAYFYKGLSPLQAVCRKAESSAARFTVSALTKLYVHEYVSDGRIYPGAAGIAFSEVARQYDGVSVKLIGAVGDDVYGRVIVNELSQRGLDLEHIQVLPHGLTKSLQIAIDENGEREVGVTFNGVYDQYTLTENDIAQIKASDAVFTIDGYEPIGLLLKLKKTENFLLAVDFQLCENLDHVEAMLPLVDFAFISGAGEQDILPIAKSWSERYDCIFNITMGADGSVSFLSGAEYRTNAIPARKPVDTAGCGDCYHAAFLCSYLEDGDIQLAMERGADAAYRCLCSHGYMGGE